MKKKFIFSTLVAALSVFTACEQPKADATGVFEARTVMVSSEVDGRILSFDVKEGDMVTDGQELVLIDTMQYSIQKKQLLASQQILNQTTISSDVQTGALKVEIEQLEREKQRIENLIAVGAATRREKEQIETRINSLKRQIQAAEETIVNTNSTTSGNKNVNAIQIESVDLMLERCRIKAPLAGTVICTYADKGEMTGAGHPLIKISDLEDVWLTAYFPGSKLVDIGLGQKVTVKTLYGSETEKEYEGTITWIASESQFSPKSVPNNDDRSNIVFAVRISIKNDGKVRPGLNGEVWLK